MMEKHFDCIKDINLTCLYDGNSLTTIISLYATAQLVAHKQCFATTMLIDDITILITQPFFASQLSPLYDNKSFVVERIEGLERNTTVDINAVINVKVTLRLRDASESPDYEFCITHLSHNRLTKMVPVIKFYLKNDKKLNYLIESRHFLFYLKKFLSFDIEHITVSEMAIDYNNTVLVTFDKIPDSTLIL